MAANVAAGRVAGIASGRASGEKQRGLLLNRLPRPSARVSAQPTTRKNLLVAGRAATNCLSRHGTGRASDFVPAYVVRLLERLSEECRADLRLGLLSPTMARQLTRLPAGNQIEVVAAARREHLTTAEIHAVVDLIVACASRPQMDFILQQPRRALRQAQIESLPAWDPRLSAAGNRILRQLGGVLSGLGRMENWLRHKGRADLAPCDRSVLLPSFQRLTRDARAVAELTEDLLTEIDLP